MQSPAETYFAAVTELLRRARDANQPVLGRLGAIVGRSVAAGGVVHTFGSGHSEIVAREIVGRAGGLAGVSAIIDPAGGIFENVVGYGARLVERHDQVHGLCAGEAVIVISNSG